MSITKRCFATSLLVFLAFIICIHFFSSPACAEDEPTEPLPDSQSTGMISTAGLDQIGYTGAAVSQLPILVPPGRGGIAPNLALTYSSYGQNGHVGVGWSLDVGSIQRATRKGVDYNGNEFVGAGSDEIVPRPDWGSNYYGARFEGGYAKYYHDSVTGGWIVTTKQGIKQYYGTTADSRQDSTKGIFKWCLDRVEDTNGNYMTLSYIKDQGDILIDRIDYTGHTSGLLPSNSVQFYYGLRNDEQVMYSTNAYVKMTKRLKIIEIHSLNNEPVRKYELVYSYSAATGRSRLEEVYQFGVDYTPGGVTEWVDGRLPMKQVLGLNYQAGGGGGVPLTIEGALAVGVGAGLLEPTRTVPLDFNGDGRMDLIVYRLTSWHLYMLQANSSGSYDILYSGNDIPGTGIYLSQPLSITALDYNGDGATDILIYREDGSVALARYNGQGGFIKDYDSVTWGYPCGDPGVCDYQQFDMGIGGVKLNPIATIEDPPSLPRYEYDRITPFDYDGDGRMDIVIHQPRDKVAAGSVAILKSNGDGTFTKYYDSVGAKICPADAPCYFENLGIGGITYLGKLTKVVPLDYNGDGRTDLLVYTPTSTPQEATKISINKSNGDGTFTNEYLSTSIAGFNLGYYEIDTIVPFDYNGDGRADLLIYSPGRGLVTIAKSQADGNFEAEYSSTTGIAGFNLQAQWDRIVPLDYNGDGMSDLLLYRTGQGLMTIVRSKGNGDFPLAYQSTSGLGTFLLNNYADYIIPADTNADGKTDLTLLRPQDSMIYSAHPVGEIPDLLSSIHNEFSGVTDLSYANSSSYQNTFLPFVVHPVAAVSINDGNGNISTASYTYAGGYHDLLDRQFRGFFYIKKTLTDGSYAETWYNQDDYLKGRINTVQSYTPGGVLAAETNNFWGKEVLDSQYDVNFIKLNTMQSLSYENDGTYVWSREDYDYDPANGNLLTKTTSGTDAENVVMRYQYANYGAWTWRPTQTTLEKATGEILRKTLNQYFSGTGNLQYKESWLDGGTNPRVSMLYDDYGNVRVVTDPMGQETTTEYETATYTYPFRIIAPATNGVPHVIENPHYDYRFGKVTESKDENLNSTYYTYDIYGRSYGVAYPNGYPNGGESIVYRYDNVFPRYSKAVVKETATGPTIDQYTYLDGLGRKIETINIGAEGKPIVTRFFYDNMGRNYRVEGPFYGSVDNNFAFDQTPLTADYPWHETSYDDRGRPYITRSPRPNGEAGEITTTLSYYGLFTTVTDPDGARKTERKDYLGRLIQVTEYPESGPQTTNYTYNIAGDLLTTVDCLSNTTTINYDTLGRKTNMTDPDMGFVQYVYNANGKLIQQTDAKNNTISFTYDELGRVRTKTYSSGEPTITYAYDNTSIPNGKGRLASVTNTTATTTINAYDEMGKTTSVTQAIAGNSTNYTTQYAYDLAGKQTSITYPDGYQVAYSYYPGTGLLMDVTSVTDGKNYAHYSLYEPTGKIGQVDLGNGTSTSYTYDPRTTRLYGIVTSDPGGLPANDIQNMSYAYTDAGDISRIVDNKRGVTSNYTYDLLHRLISETHNGNYTPRASSLMYGYDASHVHAVKNVNINGAAFTHAYDPNGNMTAGFDYADAAAIGTRTIAYNADDKPTQVTYVKGGNTAIVDFSYDGEGGRAKKSVPGGSTTYYLGGHYEVTDGVPTKHIFAGPSAIAKITGTTIYYYHKDHLGSSTAMTDATGQVVEKTEYMPFGPVREHTGTTVTNYKYTDQELDPETGLYYYGARYYDPTMGVFISADTIVQNFSDPQTLNRYSYVRNNPLIYTDPSGHFGLPVIVIGAVIGAVMSGAQSGWDPGAMFQGALIGGITAAAAYGAASWAYELGGKGAAGFILGGMVGGAAGGAVNGGLSALVYGGEDPLRATVQGAAVGASTGSISGAASAAGVPVVGDYLIGYLECGESCANRKAFSSLAVQAVKSEIQYADAETLTGEEKQRLLSEHPNARIMTQGSNFGQKVMQWLGIGNHAAWIGDKTLPIGSKYLIIDYNGGAVDQSLPYYPEHTKKTGFRYNYNLFHQCASRFGYLTPQHYYNAYHYPGVTFLGNDRVR